MDTADSPRDAAALMRPGAQEPRWSILRAALCAWCFPKTAARRTNHVALPYAFAVQIAVGILVAAMILVFASAAQADECTLAAILGELAAGRDEFLHEFDGRSLVMTMAIAAVALSIEAGVLVLAALLMPWGARDERMCDSFRAAVRRTLIQLTQAVPVAILIGGSASGLELAKRQWEQTSFRPAPQPPPKPATALAPNAPEKARYDKAYKEYRTSYWKWRRDARAAMPWYLEESGALVGAVAVSSICWLIWGLLRAVGAPRTTKPILRPPMCENCGYNLTATAMGGRCSECGAPVSESLGPDVRPGVAWQRRRLFGTLRAVWATSSDLIADPKAFGRRIRVTDDSVDHRSFFAWHLPAIFLIGPTGVVLSILFIAGESIPFRFAIPLMGILGIFASLIGVGVMLLSCLAVGIWFRRREGRNLLAAAVQIACYMSTVLVCCEVVCVFSLAFVMGLAEFDVLDSLARMTRFGDEELAMLIFGVPCLGATVYYLSLLVRATSGTRYANHRAPPDGHSGTVY